ncbi:hypothetical protein shim_18100 [Shimia sp. SK013]|uniref:DUF1801 domain-containing protein n=1 Tax=Shimia sp. SK013 TaxID=1389006 RepID=UPI0006B635E6|nr:DUF1801 domain-containing protein [Shimia sp. SK013]KPA21925.1 hypothetical protein shim_18100 [Shimia sp. SK013]
MTKTATPLPAQIAPAIAALPKAPQDGMRALRDLICDTAAETGALPIEESLKWGQPSFAPPKRDGTPIRLGWSADAPDRIAMLVHCQTTVVEAWRERFGDAFTYDGSRALFVPLDAPLDTDALRHAIALALTYRR